MQFSTILAALSATCALSAPLTSQIEKRGVFSVQTFNDMSISGGVAGNAEAEALAKFSNLNMNNLASADQADISFIQSVNAICNQAEVQAYVPAIAAARGEARAALQRGMTKNKVLKIVAQILRLRIDQAQGQDTAAQIAAEQVKLDNNNKQDKAQAGKSSTFLSFDASTS